jgi:hypothetical protein
MKLPTYSPIEALNRAKLMMGYDPTKTLTENKESVKGLIKEDDIDTDTEKSVKRVLDSCNSRTPVEGTLDAASIASAFNRSFNYQTAYMFGGTDDSLWRAQAAKMKKGNMDDLCNIKREFEDLGYGDFTEKLVDELDDEELAELMETFSAMSYKTKKESRLQVDSTEQKNINEFKAKFRCVFDSDSNVDSKVYLNPNKYTYIKVRGTSGRVYQLFYSGALKDWNGTKWVDTGKFLNCDGRKVVVESEQKKRLVEDFDDSGIRVKTPTPTPTGGGGGGTRPAPAYRNCTGTYKKGCKTDPSAAIGKVQACLQLTADGKYGNKTDAKLKSMGYTSFTDADVDKICNVPAPEVSGEIIKIDPSNTDF